jgi:hypothetical protein
MTRGFMRPTRRRHADLGLPAQTYSMRGHDVAYWQFLKEGGR